MWLDPTARFPALLAMRLAPNSNLLIMTSVFLVMTSHPELSRGPLWVISAWKLLSCLCGKPREFWDSVPWKSGTKPNCSVHDTCLGQCGHASLCCLSFWSLQTETSGKGAYSPLGWLKGDVWEYPGNQSGKQTALPLKKLGGFLQVLGSCFPYPEPPSFYSVP